MNCNVSFSGKLPQPKQIEGVTKEIAERYTPPFATIKEGLTESSAETLKKADAAIANTFKPYNILEAEARATKKAEQIAEEFIEPSVPFN